MRHGWKRFVAACFREALQKRHIGIQGHDIVCMCVDERHLSASCSNAFMVQLSLRRHFCLSVCLSNTNRNNSQPTTTSSFRFNQNDLTRPHPPKHDPSGSATKLTNPQMDLLDHFTPLILTLKPRFWPPWITSHPDSSSPPTHLQLASKTKILWRKPGNSNHTKTRHYLT